MTASTGVCYTEEEKARIQLQLDRLLANIHFSNSKRFPSFLRFIVQEELEGRGDQLKERTLGIEVFNRSPDYDTSLDPNRTSTARRNDDSAGTSDVERAPRPPERCIVRL